MRTIIFILQKEFKQIFRNKTLLPIIFVVPVVQLVVLIYAANMEMKNVKMMIIDRDLSTTSSQLFGKFEGSRFFTVEITDIKMQDAESYIKDNRVDAILIIPGNFEKNLIKTGSADIQILINAINSTSGGLINAYVNNIMQSFNAEVIKKFTGLNFDKSGIGYKTRFFYNPELDYKIYMLPGILVILVTIIGAFLTALNIVREKELGTIEQINVTPIKKHQFIIGKLIPFWIIAMFEFSFGLTIGYFFFNLPVEGSLILVFSLAAVYLILALGFGLFLSAISQTQHQVMFVIFFFLIVFILMSGIFTPTESMPEWAQKVNIINPFAYLIKALRMVLLKGSTFWDVSNEFFSLLVYGIIVLSLAIWRYRKTV
ncbi:MAG: ABC transporter permease [Marinilabiliales bacterium]